MTAPPVTIGLPVHNGARHLAATVESILAQTFTDFRLVISDNASSDETAEIAGEFAAGDDRVTFHRREQNLGANANYNGLVARADGSDYFKWSAHDDLVAPDYLARCVEMLEARPEAVGGHSLTALIDDEGCPLLELEDSGPGIPCRNPGSFLTTDGLIGYVDPPEYSEGLADTSPTTRFEALVRHVSFNGHIFSVLRLDALRATRLQLPFYGADKMLVGELALRGPFVTVGAPLWLRRVHRGASVQMDDRADQARWADSTAGRPAARWMLTRALAGAVRRASISPRQRRACWRMLALNAMKPRA